MGAINTANAVIHYSDLPNPNLGSVGAAVYLHAGSVDPVLDQKIRIPILTTTGTADEDVKPARTRLSWQEQTNAHPRVFINLEGAGM